MWPTPYKIKIGMYVSGYVLFLEHFDLIKDIISDYNTRSVICTNIE